MGQSHVGWCGINHAYATSGVVPPVNPALAPRSFSRSLANQNASEVDSLLADCPRELADTLRNAGQWDALRCRPWLSANGFRGLLRSLHRCQLHDVMARRNDADTLDESSLVVPPVIPWDTIENEHVISAGQTFKLMDAPHGKVSHLRRLGLAAMRQGKVGAVLLAGGANLRFQGSNPPIGCTRSLLQIPSGKSIVQLCCERIRRIVELCRAPGETSEQRKHPLSIPVFVMTSKLTHKAVVAHFESNRYFGLLPRDVTFFEQPVYPALDDYGRLLPQSLGGEFAHAPGGTGDVIGALANSSALEQMRDRGVECLHIVGIENALARVCDPVFIGFCRELEVDCACKTIERVDAYEDLELFCIRQNPVTTHLADIEEAACGLPSTEAVSEVLEEKTDNVLSYAGFINSTFFAVSYIEEVVGRPVRSHKLPRVLPYLDFYTSMFAETTELHEFALSEQPDSSSVPEIDATAGVAVGSWPAETPSLDLDCQLALLSTAAEARTLCQPSPGDVEEAWRCDVVLDSNGPTAIVKVGSVTRGPLFKRGSIAARSDAMGLPSRESNYRNVLEAAVLQLPLRSSLVVPALPNAHVLEVSLLDYFEYTDRAVALQVERRKEFAAMCDRTGPRSPGSALTALRALHRSWVLNVNAKLADLIDPGASVEVSPLLSYEGEGLEQKVNSITVTNKPPFLLVGKQEVCAQEQVTVEGSTDETDVVEVFDTRPFYMQEYPQRLQMNTSHAPQFRTSSRPMAVL